MTEVILERLRETSTWRGIVYLLMAAGVTLTPEQQGAVISAGLALVGLIAMFFPDKKEAPK